MTLLTPKFCSGGISIGRTACAKAMSDTSFLVYVIHPAIIIPVAL